MTTPAIAVTSDKSEVAAPAVTTAAPPKALAPAAKKVPAKRVKKIAAAVPGQPIAKASKPAAKKEKPVAKPTVEKIAKVKKLKMVRDSLSMPKLEYAVLDTLKLRAAKLANPAKKTELIRAGIKAIAAMSDAAFLAAIKAVPSIKTGRPAGKKSA